MTKRLAIIHRTRFLVPAKQGLLSSLLLGVFALAYATGAPPLRAQDQIERFFNERDLKRSLQYQEGENAQLMGDLDRAYEIWHRLAQQGYAPAEYQVGGFYDSGAGPVRENPAKAAFWYGRAADNGFAIAQSALGDLFARGRGVPANPAQAVRLWREAAKQGHGPAALRLGLSYLSGKGVRRDEDRARYWLRLAADSGIAEAQRALVGIEKNVDGAASIAQTTEAQESVQAVEATPTNAPARVDPAVPKERPVNTAESTLEAGKVIVPASTEVAARSDHDTLRNSPPPRGTFSAWLVSESDQRSAQAYWRLAREGHPNSFSRLAGYLHKVDVGGLGTFHRVLAGNWNERKFAEGFCRQLRQQRPGLFCKILEN